MRAVLALLSFVLASGSLVARAEPCPEVPDDEVALRRSLAKEWFAKAEEAETSGDRQGAIRRYACSLGLAPHPSTAYNLGTVAEKTGDLSAALDGFRTYLKLSPEATDRPAIEARIIALEAKVSELRKQIAPTAAAAPAASPAAPATAVPPTPAATAPPTPPAPPAGANAGTAGHARRVAGAVTAAGAGVALVTGIVLNVMARSKMSTCFSQYSSHTPGALDRCDEAKPLAYGSYAAFGVAGAAGVVGGILLLGSSSAGPEEPPEVALGPALLPGGAAFVATGRF
jgi:hypothetical protein